MTARVDDVALGVLDRASNQQWQVGGAAGQRQWFSGIGSLAQSDAKEWNRVRFWKPLGKISSGRWVGGGLAVGAIGGLPT
jgi:hypothetical protein